MKIAYFDCFSGMSGDMTLGALVDAGLDFAQLQADLAKLPVSGYSLQMVKTVKNGISGTKINVLNDEQHVHRHLNHIRDIIETAALADQVKRTCVAAFQRLAEAEAKVHNTTVEQVHFHEVGALDAIVDIVGSVLGLWRLGVEKVYASPLNTGRGFTKCAHGTIPVPAPATTELLKGIPVFSNDIEAELVTPTGAALISTLCRDFGAMPLMQVTSTGYGAGERDLAIPNLLRVSIGEIVEPASCGDTVRFGGQSSVNQEPALILEANIDDMNPEFYDYLINKLLQAGAMDAFLQDIQMKKNRPGQMLKVLLKPGSLESVYRQIFCETTTIGVRVYPVTKYMLPYEIIAVGTELGTARVKVARWNGKVTNVAPEYEDCRLIAQNKQLPLKQVYDIFKFAAMQQCNKVD